MALSCACHFGVTFGYWAISQARRSLPRSPPQKSICWNILPRARGAWGVCFVLPGSTSDVNNYSI